MFKKLLAILESRRDEYQKKLDELGFDVMASHDSTARIDEIDQIIQIIEDLNKA